MVIEEQRRRVRLKKMHQSKFNSLERAIQNGEKESLFNRGLWELFRPNRAVDSWTQPQWGSMTAAQMLAHCAEIQEVSNGKELKNTPFIAKLFRGMIRKMVINDKPYPKNTKTHPQYLQTKACDFANEKKRLLDALGKICRWQRKIWSTRTPAFLAKWPVRKKAGVCTSTWTIIWLNLVFKRLYKSEKSSFPRSSLLQITRNKRN